MYELLSREESLTEAGGKEMFDAVAVISTKNPVVLPACAVISSRVAVLHHLLVGCPALYYCCIPQLAQARLQSTWFASSALILRLYPAPARPTGFNFFLTA